MSGRAVAGRPRAARLASWAIFVFTTVLMLALCLAGGRFGFIGERSLKLALGAGSVSIPAGPFIALFAATWLVCGAMLVSFPRRVSVHSAYLLLLGTALLCRLALLTHGHSDDVYRYLWEGRLVRAGVSPYAHSPQDAAVADLARDDPYHAGINHPDLPAAYPPFMLLVFGGITGISYSPMAVKLLMIAFDLGALAFLIGMLQRRGLALRWAALYAFNPVILYSFAGQAHLDAAHAFFLTGALACHDRKRWRWMFLFAGLAVQSKYVAVLALPFLLRRDNWRHAWVLVAAVVLPYAAFIGGGWRPLFFSLRAFGEEFAFNGSAHGVLLGVFGRIAPATRVCKLLAGAVYLAGVWLLHPERSRRFRDDPVSGCFFAMGALLLFAPTVHFWYVSWIVPFIVLRPHASWSLLCLTISGYFVTNGIYHHTGEWRLPLGVQVAEWLPFWILIARDLRLSWSRLGVSFDSAAEHVSVVIPARNEASGIGACVAAARHDPAVREVIVVDGASTDDTARVAREAGALVVSHALGPGQGGGRGGQVAAGLAQAAGDVVAIVHADTLVPAHVFPRMLEVLRKQPLVVGGAVGSLFDGARWHLRLLEYANDFRAACLGISFGDQVQFFRRQIVLERQAFPAIPLMEDVELALRLPHLGRVVYLFGDALVSTRRWQSGCLRRAVLVIRLVLAYLWQRLRGRPDTAALFRQYYGGGR